MHLLRALSRYPRRILRWAANAYIQRTSTLLLALGLLLIVIGGGMQVVRVGQEAAIEDVARQAPSFERSVRAVPTAVPRQAPVVVATPPRPDRIVIPALDLDEPVVEVGWESRIINGEHKGNVWRTASYAAGFHKNSARLGQPGNTVLSGHNNVDGAVFKDIHTLMPGDRIHLLHGDQRYTYAVEQNFFVPEADASPEERRQNAQWINETPDTRLTLVTCYPPWGNTHRTLVIARPVPEESGWAREGVADAR